jgi:tRNA U34 2-thiouridine synthase MnmA/TrmU
MVRYRARPAAAIAEVRGGTLHLEFAEPQRAVTPGQLVALYDPAGSEVLGAATIQTAA